MFRLQGNVERESEKAILFSAMVLAPAHGGPSRISTWFPKSRIVKHTETDLYFEDSNEWLLSAKEREMADGKWQFVTFAAE